MLTTVTSEVSMKVDSRLLTKLGITSVSACGRMTFCCVRHHDSPSAAAASYCPFGSACRPPRTTSAMYAAWNSTMPSAIRVSTSMRMPCGSSSGNTNDAVNSTVMSGTPRTSSM